MSGKSKKLLQDYRVVGIMSGSSLDGLDLCLTKFNPSSPDKFHIEKAETIEIPSELKENLRSSDKLQSLDLLTLDIAYGQWIGQKVLHFINGHERIDVIGVHGHTVFHHPDLGVSLQIGAGSAISQVTGIPVVDRFREKDVLLGGQGAPLVPFGEKFLFPTIPVFINLGGIANISIHQNGVRAWDIAPCNQVLNHFAMKLGHAFDRDGLIARSGEIDPIWLRKLRSMPYFEQSPPKSLANQFTKVILEDAPERPENGLHTYSHFIAELITQEIHKLEKPSEILFSGGGAKNQFLMSSVSKQLPTDCSILSASETIIEYKEALIFGFLAMNRLLWQPNILSETTGSKTDTCSGVLHLPN